ncbi:MAG TPA: cation transporter [Ktedonobacterales bacterium]|jgi:divalent metal cation (Fe/Co/Zn/Cd) transporter
MPDSPAISLPAQGKGSSLARRADLRLGIAVEVVTILWMLAEALVALIAGFAAHSASLESFGLDSVIELVSGGVLLWRLLAEQGGRAGETLERVERRASRIVGLALYALAAYILLNAAFSLLTRAHPDESWAGLALALAAAVVMPILWRVKLRVARRIESAALRADAACSVTCAYMSLVLLLGLALTRVFGWWWADALASLGLLYFVIREGHEALEEAKGHACACCEAGG